MTTRPSFGFSDIKPTVDKTSERIDQAGERLGFSSREAPVRRKRRNLAVAEPTDQLNLRAAIADINLFVEWCEQRRMSYREGFGLLVRRIND